MAATAYDLILDIAKREKKAKQLCQEYGYSKAELQSFVEQHKELINLERQRLEVLQDKGILTSNEEGELWITSKHERLKRYQFIVDHLFQGEYDTVSLREIRTYLFYAAQEVGQLMSRGSGASDEEGKLTYEIKNVNMEDLS